MMIPSEMPVRMGENGHGSYGEAGHNLPAVFPQFGPDQITMLQSLQQIGQKQKEVREFYLTSL